MANEIEDKILKHNEIAQANTQKLTKLMSELQVLKSKCGTLQNKININQTTASYYDSCNYQQKINDLTSEIENSKMTSSKMEASIASQTKKWNTMYSVAQMQIKEGIESANAERSLNQIHSLVE